MSVNVNREVTDIFYRYKMPYLVAKVEGKGNGIKTVIANMTDVGKALGRPPTYPTKYFGCELGAQTRFDAQNDRFIVNGSHEASRLQELLDGFIKKFVLCPSCENPETVLSVKSQKTISQRCQACGHGGMIDMTHKLTQFILKHPPTSENGKDEKPGKAGKGKGKGKKDKDHDEVNGNGENESAKFQRGDDVGFLPTVGADEDDEDWGSDDDQVPEELTLAMKELIVAEDVLEKSAAERGNMFYAFVKTCIDNGTVATSSSAIYQEAVRLDVADKAPVILIELLMTPENCLNQIVTYRKHFLLFTNGNNPAQRSLLRGFELFIKENENAPDIMKKVPHALKRFYDEDILVEEVILKWGHDGMKKTKVPKDFWTTIRSHAEPFVNWLETAESEEDEEDDDIVLIGEKPAPTAPVSSVKQDDDLDIDDI